MTKSQEIATGVVRGLAESLPEQTGAVLIIARNTPAGIELAYAATFSQGVAESLASMLVLAVGVDKARELVDQMGPNMRAASSGDA